MANETDCNDEETRDWESRLAWVFGLIAEDPVDRAAALVRHTEARERVCETLERFNEAWYLTRPLGAERRHESAYTQAWEAYRDAQRHAFPDALSNRPYGGLSDWPGLPYALLYLEWEATYPQTWTCHAKHWGVKEDLIRDLAVGTHSNPVRTKLGELLDTAIRRAYRCKDREYVRIARAIDSADLRVRLTAAADSSNPWARLHAGYVLHLLEHPELSNTRRTWQAWCAGTTFDRPELQQ